MTNTYYCIKGMSKAFDTKEKAISYLIQECGIKHEYAKMHISSVKAT